MAQLFAANRERERGRCKRPPKLRSLTNHLTQFQGTLESIINHRQVKEVRQSDRHVCWLDDKRQSPDSVALVSQGMSLSI